MPDYYSLREDPFTEVLISPSEQIIAVIEELPNGKWRVTYYEIAGGATHPSDESAYEDVTITFRMRDPLLKGKGWKDED